MKLQNTVMQLRKVCSHPFLFDWPLDPGTHQPILNEDLVNASGKMMVLDRLLCELFRRKHKVLLFSQFTTMLDIIEVRCLMLFMYLTSILTSRRTGPANSKAGGSVGSMGRRLRSRDAIK
jgi:SNF2 family DNA or RNA helicase